jgi:hypothetical protein
MSHIEATSQIIKNILGIDETLRKQSEEQLVEASKSKTNDLFPIILALLKSSPEKDIRSFCAIFLRKHLSIYSEKNFES